MLEVKIRKTKPIFKYLRSLKHKEYVTDLDVTDLTNITFAVIDKNGEKQDTISVKINIDILNNENLYRYNLYQGYRLILENETSTNIIRKIKNYLLKFEQEKNSKTLDIGDRVIDLYAYSKHLCKKVGVDFNIPIEISESDSNDISMVISDSYGVKSIVISDNFLENNDNKFVFNVFKLQLLRFIVHERRRPYTNSKPYFINLMNKHELIDYKNYAKIRKIG